MKTHSTRRTIIALAAALPLVFAAGSAAAQRGKGRGPGPGMHGPGGMGGFGPAVIERLSVELGLTAQQKAQVDRIADDMRRANIKTRAEIQLVQVDLHNELMKDEPDVKKAMAMIDKIAAGEVAMKKAHINALLSIKKVLTKEQRAKLGTLAAKHGGPGWMHGEGGAGMGPGPGPGPRAR